MGGVGRGIHQDMGALGGTGGGVLDRGGVAGGGGGERRGARKGQVPLPVTRVAKC